MSIAEFSAAYRGTMFGETRAQRIIACLPPRMTGYGDGVPRRTWTVEWYRLAFELRIRVPDRVGFYGPDVTGAQWCLPWNWARLYYVARGFA